MSIKQALQLGRMSEIAGYDVNENNGIVNLINMFDGSSTGWMSVDDAFEFLNCL